MFLFCRTCRPILARTKPSVKYVVFFTFAFIFFHYVDLRTVFVSVWDASDATLACRIPSFRHMDPSVRQFITRLDMPPCLYDDQFAYIVGNVLQINQTTVRNKNWTVDHCSYQTIYRPDVGSDNKILLAKKVIFNHSVLLRESDVFLKVQCFNDSKTVLSTCLLTTIIPRKKVEDRCEQNRKQFGKEHNKLKEHFNVVMFGTDSVSLANSMRHLVKSRDFLLRQLNAVELKGYNKIGSNTFPNFIALFTGKSTKEFFNGTSEKGFVFGDNDFLWNMYSRAGYRTLFGEDLKQIATFNYLAPGFGKAPADYYMRPFIIASEGLNTSTYCRNDIWHMRQLLDWTSRFTETFAKQPHFSLSYCAATTHDYLNYASYFDTPAFEFMRRLRDSGAFQRNTIMIMFSDHGLRYGAITQTPIGRLEINLPMMYIVFPVWFRKRYPVQWERLQINAGRLTTPYDVHATLLHALAGFDEASAPRTLHGRSLLAGEVPRNRTCASAAIPRIFCACRQQRILTRYDEAVRGAANAIVDWINSFLTPYAPRCAKLAVANISSAMLQLPTKGWPMRSYTLAIRAEPGHGDFEGTVDYNPKYRVYNVYPELKRLNMYGNESYCVQDAIAQRYCYCAIQPKAKNESMNHSTT